MRRGPIAATRLISPSSRTEKVPFVASGVDEDGYAAVRLVTRFGEELDTVIEHAAIAGIEVVYAKEKPDASGELIPNRCLLVLTVGLSQ